MPAMPRPVVALITAYNEAETIGGVIDAAKAASLITRVQVVDDASTDATFEVASENEGVRVIRLEKRIPVGAALLHHLRHLEEKDAIVFFCDADLRGLRPGHIDAIVRPVLENELGMCVGLKDKRRGALIKWFTMVFLPKMDILIGGERAMYREIADSVLACEHSSGYGLVIVMNRFCRKYKIPVRVVYMDGCDHRNKIRKWGLRDALPGLWRLVSQVFLTLVATTVIPSATPEKTFDKLPCQ